ncbi:MAG: M6 family metalloprotease domain-containing protein [Gemmataceae bacterium]
MNLYLLRSLPAFGIALVYFLVATPVPATSQEKEVQKQPIASKKPEKPKTRGPDLSEFKTVETARTTKIQLFRGTTKSIQPPYLGLYVTDKNGQLVISDVAEKSPAAEAKLKIGDLVLKVEKLAPTSRTALRDVIMSKSPGDKLTLVVRRGDKTVDISLTLGKTSRPYSSTGSSRGSGAVMGIRIGRTNDKIKGVPISSVTPQMPADRAGMKSGDIVRKIDTTSLNGSSDLLRILSRKRPGDKIKVVVRRGKKELTLDITLGSRAGRTGRGFDTRFQRRYWTKSVYRLAVIPVEFVDVKQNEKITTRDWETALFSKGEYTEESPTGQKVFGSLNDYYQEQSYGKLKVTGKVFEYVPMSKKRDAYGTGSKSVFFREAVENLLKRDGKDALDEFDGLFFLYAGRRARAQRGGLYWPHRATTFVGRKRWSYFICPEGGTRMDSISVIAHEFGHMLGLPDLYAREGSGEGLGIWCTMAIGHGRSGCPRHFSAWCKERLGWIDPTVIDPTVQQKLILSPVYKSSQEVYKVLVRPDGSEYLLLENRIQKGFDKDLPAGGLLVWRVVNGRPVLQESHGITSTRGPKLALQAVPFPSKANDAYTPYTTPSSKSSRGSGLPIHITNIKKLPDGRITFFIGYEYF